MFKVLAKLLETILPSAQTGASGQGDIHTDIHGRRIPGAEVYFYPQQIRGVPVFDIESILKHYKDDIKKLERFLPIGDHQCIDGRTKFDVMYLDVIKRFAEYVHLIPASEDHHHKGPGGLLIHSIESAFNSLLYAENKKFIKTGLADIDKEMSVRARYAAWIGGLLHDTGKILRDLHVNAVDVVVNAKSGKVEPARNVPTWLPHMQTLIEWATEHKVASYTVSFIRNRKHNRHNVDSSHLLPYIIGRGHAMKYLVDTPGVNLYSELNSLLSGMESGSYLSRAVREGDALSTAKDMTVYRDAMLGVKAKSVGSRICVLMKLAKADWEWNTPGGCGWIIGDDCYLRWPQAFNSIVKASIKHDLAIPHEITALLDVMENHGLIKAYSKEQRALKFIKGQFNEDDARQIANGSKQAAWEELIRVTWDGHLFGDDPKPNNCKGLIFHIEEREYIFIDRAGVARLLHKSEVTEAPESTAAAKPDNSSGQMLETTAVKSTDSVQNAEPKTDNQSVPAAIKTAELPQKPKKPQSKTKANEQAQLKTDSKPTPPMAQTANQNQPKPATKEAQVVETQFDLTSVTGAQTPVKTTGIIFTRKPKNEGSEGPQPQLSASHHENSQPPAEATKAEPATSEQSTAKVPAAIQSLLDKGAKVWSFDGKYLLEISSESGIGQQELKAIKSQYLATDTGTVLAQNYTLNGMSMVAATIRQSIGQLLEAAGVVTQILVQSQSVETAANKPSKKPKPDEKKKSVTTKSATSPGTKSNAGQRQFDEGTLGWILVNAGVDISTDQITFEKSIVKDAHDIASIRLKWSNIETTIKKAGFEIVVGQTTLTVQQDALATQYWTPTNE